MSVTWQDMEDRADLGHDTLGFQNHILAKRTGWNPDAVGPNTRTTLMDAWDRNAPIPKPIHPITWAFLTVSAFLSIWAVIFTGQHLTHNHRVVAQVEHLTCFDDQGRVIPKDAGNVPFKECHMIGHVL